MEALTTRLDRDAELQHHLQVYASVTTSWNKLKVGVSGFLIALLEELYDRCNIPSATLCHLWVVYVENVAKLSKAGPEAKRRERQAVHVAQFIRFIQDNVSHFSLGEFIDSQSSDISDLKTLINYYDAFLVYTEGRLAPTTSTSHLTHMMGVYARRCEASAELHSSFYRAVGHKTPSSWDPLLSHKKAHRHQVRHSPSPLLTKAQQSALLAKYFANYFAKPSLDRHVS